MKLPLHIFVVFRILEFEIRNVEGIEISKRYFINQGFIIQRSLHIVVQLLNICMGSTLVVLFFGLGICQVISAFILLNPHTAALTPIPLKIVCAIVACFVFPTLLIVYGFAGKFYDDSIKFLQDLQRKVKLTFIKQTKRRIEYEKFLVSCQVQKIRFGLTNFIDKLTPLVFQQFCMDRIIDLVLVQK